MTKINLQIDDKFAEILANLKITYPLLEDLDIIKLAVGDFYIRNQKVLLNLDPESIPDLNLTPTQKNRLENIVEESIASGFVGEMDLNQLEICLQN